MDHTAGTRVDLPSGGWVTIRKLKVRDLKMLRKTSRDRGYEDATLDGLALLPQIITSWSGDGDFNEAVLDDMDIEDTDAILAEFNRLRNPNVSEPSSNGSGTGAEENQNPNG